MKLIDYVCGGLAVGAIALLVAATLQGCGSCDDCQDCHEHPHQQHKCVDGVCAPPAE